MNGTELKSLKAQLQITTDINGCNETILQVIKTDAETMYDHLHTEYYQATMNKCIKDEIEISMKDYEAMKDLLRILINTNYSSLQGDYITHVMKEKKTKKDFLEMLN